MKAMGYAQQVLQTLSLSGNTLTGNGKKGNENYTSSVDLSGLHVANADKDGSDNNIEQTYAKKSDPNSTITFKKLKLKEPFSLSSPASDDYLCAFDANDGELSKTNISVQRVAALKNTTIGAVSGGVNDTYVNANGNYMVYICIQNSNKSIYAFGSTTNGTWAYYGYTVLYWYV